MKNLTNILSCATTRLCRTFATVMTIGMLSIQAANAQNIVNPSFENGTDGWTNTGLVKQTNSSFKQKSGATYMEKWVASGSSVGTASIKQVVKGLEPGKYTLTVAAQNLNQSNETQKCTGAKIYAGKVSTTVYTPADYTVEFTHITGDIEIGFSATNASGNWLAVDNFRLVRTGDPDVADMKAAINSLIDEIRKSIPVGGTLALYDELETALTKAQNVVANEATTAEQAVEAYNELTVIYDDFRHANASENMPYEVTDLIVNNSFETDFSGWKTDGFVTQTNSSFTKKDGSKYIEKWVSSGTAVGDASVTQNVKLPNGKYKLVVAAQNLSQSSTTKKCEGAYIVGGDQQETVYTPADYTVRFTSITGEATIGYIAKGATGNWLAADNFRLYLVGQVDMTAIVAEIERTVTEAEALQSQMMSATAAKSLADAIVAGKKISATSNDADIQNAKKALDAAIANAESSIAEYKALADKITEIAASYDATKQGADAFNAELEKARALVTDANATSQQLADEITALDKAALAFLLANATPGTGTAVKVTATNHHVVTGATEALMRATMTGSNILERGVCWSTEHNPTVLDNRTTKFMTLNGNIYHVKGLKTATVYYLRPYVMNKTYEVAYGDEVKIVTHPTGTCSWSWDEAGPDEATNNRCRTAIKQTIDYFNEWTGIRGFHLSGHYVPGAGAGGGTADCSYGGWMRISQNAANQAIGTVLHETGHGVGVGTSSRYADTNVHNWKWYGREANRIYTFLENKEADPYNSDFCMVGDGTHSWGSSATYDWFINGADKDKHMELQYIGGCALLYGMFIDGLNPTSAHHNGIQGYTYNFDDAKKYYIMSKDADHGLGSGLLYQYSSTGIGWHDALGTEEVSDSSAWYMEYNPQTCYYRFRNALTGNYLSYSSTGNNMAARNTTSPSSTEQFQLMPDRTNVTIGTGTDAFKTHGYWFTWESTGLKAMGAGNYSSLSKRANATKVDFNYSDKATVQQWIIISEDELEAYHNAYIAAAIHEVTVGNEDGDMTPVAYYSLSGVRSNTPHAGVNIIRYANGKTVKRMIK